MELWDLYDKDRNKLEKKAVRGSKLKDGEYHLVVNVWIKNSKNEYLITQRAKGRPFEFMWECTGGSAIKGENSLTAALREAYEELGINLDKNKGTLIGSTLRYYNNGSDILDVWLFEFNIDIKDIKIQKEEVNDVIWATKDEIKKLYKNNEFEANAFFEETINFNKNKFNIE